MGKKKSTSLPRRFITTQKMNLSVGNKRGGKPTSGRSGKALKGKVWR